MIVKLTVVYMYKKRNKSEKALKRKYVSREEWGENLDEGTREV